MTINCEFTLQKSALSPTEADSGPKSRLTLVLYRMRVLGEEWTEAGGSARVR